MTTAPAVPERGVGPRGGGGGAKGWRAGLLPPASMFPLWNLSWFKFKLYGFNSLTERLGCFLRDSTVLWLLTCLDSLASAWPLKTKTIRGADTLKLAALR